MRILSGDDLMAPRGVISRVLGAGAVALDDGKKAALKAEIAKPAYAGLSVAQLCDALNFPTQADNPDKQEEIRASTTIGQLKEWFRPLVFARLGDAVGQKWIQKSGLLLSQYQDSARVDYDSPTFTPLRVDALKDGLLKQSDLDTLMPLVPDPAYHPTYWQSPAERLFGAGALVENTDFVGMI